MTKEKGRIKIKFVDFPSRFNFVSNHIINILNERYDVDLSNEPDYIIFSTDGYKHLAHDCIRILFCSDDVRPDFNICDYAVGVDDLAFGDRYLHCPEHLKGPALGVSILSDTKCSEPALVESRIGECVNEVPGTKEFRDFLFNIFDQDIIRARRRLKTPHVIRLEQILREGVIVNQGQITPTSRINVIRQVADSYLSKNKEHYDFKGILIPKSLMRLDSFIDIFYPHILGFTYSISEEKRYYSMLQDWIPELRYLGDRYTQAGKIDWVKCRAGVLVPLHGSFYFNEKVNIQKEDVVFDIGAAPGDFTSTALALGAKRVHAFEPTDDGVRKLKQTMALTGSFDIVQKMIGSSKSEERGIITLDDYVKEQRLEKVNFIKMDVEGMEKDILLGAEMTLSKMCPKMAICTYHKPDDKSVLPETVWKINPDYKIIHGRSVMYCFVEK